MSLSSPNDTAMANEQQSILDTPEGKAQLCVYVLTFLLGSVGNVLVLLVVRSKKNRTFNDLFIVNLAISDLLMIGFLPVYTVKILVKFHHTTAFCKIISPLATMTYFVSVFTLTSMAIHRCYVITNPFKPEMRKWKINVWLVGLWVASFLAVLPLVLVAQEGLPGTNNCTEDWPSLNARKAYTACLFVLQYSLPLAIITAAYIRITVDLLKSSTERFGPGESLNNNRRDRKILSHARKDDIQVLKTVAVIVLVFAICLLPIQLSWMMLDFGGETEKRIALEVFFKFDVLLSILHSCLNPLVYGTVTRRYRNGYIKYLVYMCPCLKKRIPNVPPSTTSHHDNYEPCKQNGSAPHEKTRLGRGTSERDTMSTEV
ncbi:hypothetical protein OS493_015091 [Desmophyllum pertusum]|uniref:G-protein coupled receptors family 1 profile domain-containing protein n=1 Tax=Desmophyllum pertusum TaxID=174260 RepID=A0A9W9ZQU5_9CNID|nr:hypothetical protein OS493_015091 [Desmophyllum pertusum]